MSAPINTSKNANEALALKKYNVPIKLNDASIFDGAYTFMKERFTEEMRRIEDEMDLFSKILHRLNADVTSYPASVTSEREQPACFLETITNSPLLQGEGDDKTLTLQFDVSQFAPEEVMVKIIDKNLVVTAQHEVKTDASLIHNRYHREFLLPSSVDPESIESALSKDGVLIVKAPLNINVLGV